MTCSNQGRECPSCLNATRRVLGMREVNGALFPVEAEPEEEHPIDRCPVGVTALVFITVAALAGLFLVAYRAGVFELIGQILKGPL